MNQLRGLFYVVFLIISTGCSADPSPAIDAAELRQRIAANRAPVILDVRSAGEFEAGHVPGAINIAHNQLGERIGELDPTAETVVYCGSGRRAGVAEQLLREAGFVKVRDLTGHWNGWSQDEAEADPAEQEPNQG